MVQKLVTPRLRLLIPLLLLTFAAGWAVACKAAPAESGRSAPVPAAPAAAPTPAAAPAPAPTGPLVAFLGDSLTAGLGLAADQAYPAVLGRKLRAEGVPVRILNAGVSGDTTAGGLSRLNWILTQHPDVVVVGLGGNDGLRGLPIEEIDRNLREIVRRARQAGAKVLLLGMRIPPNYGPDYTGRFAALYPQIAKDLGVPLVPFLLDGVGGVPDLNQADGIHPTAHGHELVAATVEPYLKKVLASAAAAAK
ncbi:MAG TPA: arylesterase [Thermoanaerobaculia bacterium]